MVHIEVGPAIAQIRRAFQNLSTREVEQGIARALNHTAAKAKTGAAKDIRAKYQIKAKDIRRALKLARARFNYLEAKITVSGRPLPIMAFSPRQNKRGISVRIMDAGRKQVRSAFIATMPSGHKGVFARGQYGRPTFQFRRKRVRKGNDTPITELTTVAVPQAAASETVLQHIARCINTDFPPRLTHELSRIAQGRQPSAIQD